jgi:O-methyltransferase involved in polyketide biosynthesis
MGQVSVTAQRVAARCLTFPRAPAPYGDPEADQRLSRDVASDDVGGALARAGHDRETPTLFLCEGVAVYLDLVVIVSLVRVLRSGAAAGSRLAISLSTATTGERRRRFQSAVGAIGEPVRTILTAEAASELLASNGWRELPAPPERLARSARAGFLALGPI